MGARFHAQNQVFVAEICSPMSASGETWGQPERYDGLCAKDTTFSDNFPHVADPRADRFATLGFSTRTR